MDEVETGGEVQADVEVDSSAAPDAAAAPQAAPQQQQPQGPDWNSLGVPFDQAQQRLQYYQELEQRYKSDPTWAQQYDKLYGSQGQQQQGQHPYDWMNYKDEQVAKLREYGQQNQEHPDYAKHNAELNNFMYNPLGQLGKYVTHPSVMDPLYQGLAPQFQDMAQRMMQQQLGPIQQFMQQQQDQQFRAQYEKAWLALPPHIKDAHRQGRFGSDPKQAIVNAIEFSRMTPQQQADSGMGGETPAPAAVNRNTAVNKPSAPGGKKKDQGDEDLDKAAKAWRESQKK